MATGEQSYVDSTGGVYYDLTTKTGDQAAIDGSLFFTEAAEGSSGTGLIQAFVRTQATGDEAGYNTSERPLSYDENSSPQFTKSLLLNQVPVVEINGVKYYEFRLDVNQTNNNPLLSLNELKVYSSTTGTYSGEIDDPSFTGPTTLVWDLDDQNIDGTDDTDNTVLLDYSLQSGSGRSDMFFYVPVSDFNGADPDTTYVVLYSEFGNSGTIDATDGGDIDPLLYGDYSSNDGFEEWSVSKDLGDNFISGFKWLDTNGNGAWDDTESGLGGWKIDYSYTVGNGQDAHEVTGSVITSDGTTDYNEDGILDDVGYYVIPVETNHKDYVITLTEVGQDGWINTFDGDDTADYVTTITIDKDLDGLPIGDEGEEEPLNFGNFELFKISGTKYTDITGDGLTGDDTVLGGVTIFIDVNGNDIDDDGYSTVTASDGKWEFLDLDFTVAGAEVKEITPSGYVQTVGQAGDVTETDYVITGTSGTDQDGFDFANFELFNLSGHKFTDVTGDGLSSDDTGLGGITVFIDVDGNGLDDDGYSTTTADGTTDANHDGNIDADDVGYFEFLDLDYTVAGAEVKEITPSGYIQTVGQVGTVTQTNYDITGTSGADQTDLDFANFEKFDISGRKFTDITGDGLSGDDTGLGGVTVFIDVDGNGLDDDGYSTVTADGTTDANHDGNIDADDVGYFEFLDLDYTVAGAEVKEITPSGYVQTVGQIGTVTETDYEITGTSGTDQDDFDFGNFEKFDISGHKFTDITGDGLSGDDTGLGGVTVFIDVDGNGLDDDGYSTVTADGTTDANHDGNIDADDVGYFEFLDLDYTVAGAEVKEITPSGYVQTVGQVGSVTETDYEITGTSGTDQDDFDFGNFEKFDISGHKFTDITGDGLSGDDTGLGGVTVFIDVDGNGLDDDGYSTVTADGTTDANHDGNINAGDIGYWEFLDLDYSVAGAEVKEITPSGYVQTVGQAGVVTETDYIITGTSGTDQFNLDFANFLPDPKIDLEKSVKTNLFDYLPEDGDDDPDGLLAATNSTVTFKVVVTNTGNETLSDITLTDSVVHTVNGVQTTQAIVYTPDGDPATLDAYNVFVDLDGSESEDPGEAWSNFDTDGDGVIDAGEIAELAPGDSFTLYYSLDSLLGQHENTGKVDAVSAISDTDVTDSDDANYYVVEEDCVGVRTPGFWSSTKWGTFWDGVSNNQPKQAGTPGFAAGELVYAVDSDGNGVINPLDTNSDGYINGAPKDGVNDNKPVDTSVGLLIGDYNKNGVQDAGEDTIFISLADAKTLINASNKQIADGKTADGIYMLGRDVVAAWLNYLANNPGDDTGNCVGIVAGGTTDSPREYLDAAIDWLQQFASSANDGGNRLTTDFHTNVNWAKFQFDGRVAPNTAPWQNPFTVGDDIPVSAAAMHSAIDGYNNTGTIGGVEYCCDAENHSALLALNQIALV